MVQTVGQGRLSLPRMNIYTQVVLQRFLDTPANEDYRPRSYSTVIVWLFCNSAISAAKLLGVTKAGRERWRIGEVGRETNSPRWCRAPWLLHGPAPSNFTGLFLERACRSSHSGTKKLYNRSVRAISFSPFFHVRHRWFFAIAMRPSFRNTRRSIHTVFVLDVLLLSVIDNLQLSAAKTFQLIIIFKF